MNTLGNEITTDLSSLTDYYVALDNCVRELQDALLASRQELIDLQEG